MGAYSQKDRNIYEWLWRLFSTYNIDCADNETILELFEEFDNVALTNVMEVLKEESPEMFWDEEEE